MTCWIHVRLNKLKKESNNLKNSTNYTIKEVSKMGIWAWIQPVDRIWKVVSDTEKGTLLVYNEKNELILDRKGMTKEEVSLIEDNFLQIVATNLNADKMSPPQITEAEKSVREFNYMYA